MLIFLYMGSSYLYLVYPSTYTPFILSHSFIHTLIPRKLLRSLTTPTYPYPYNSHVPLPPPYLFYFYFFYPLKMESLKIIPNIKSLLENNREEDAVEIINKYIDSIAYYLKDILPQFKANTESSSLCLSKIYLILQNYEKSIEFAVKSGSLFKNDGSFYFKTLVNHMMDFLIKDNQHPCRKFIIEMIQKDVLSDSYIGYLYTIKEYEKFELFFKIYLESYDRPKEFIKFIMKSAEENNDKERIYKVIYKMYCDNKEGSDEECNEQDGSKDSNGKDEGSNEENPISIIPTNTNTSPSLFRSHTIVYFLMDSLVFLKEFNEIKNILICLEKKNPPACYDLCFYLEDNYKIKLSNIDAFGKNIPLILKGDFKRDLLQRFLTSNNLTSFRFLDSIAKTRSPHIGFVNALMNLGSTNDTFYRSNSDLLSSSKDWSKFNDVAYLGMIHLNNNLPYEVLKNYLPSESNNKEGGALYALGLINRKTYNEEDNEFLLYFLETIINEKSVNGSSCMELALGTCFGLGLINMGSNNENLIQKLLTLSKTDNTIISESAVYGLGLIALGSSNQNLSKELEILKNETEFERVKRTIGISYSLILCGGSNDNGGNVNGKGNSDSMNTDSMNMDCINTDGNRINPTHSNPTTNTHNNTPTLNFIDSLLNSKDSLSRFGGVLSLGSSYVGTGNLEIISKLLDFLNDGDDDVKRSTVISISLVCCDDQDLLISTLEPLSENHNFFVRSIVCLCLGFFNAGTGNKTCCDIVEALIHDSNNLVRQSACIGMGFLLMQCNPSIIQNYKRILDTINKIIIDRCEEPCVKHGAVIGRGISEAGGRNIIFSIKNMNNKITPERVTGAILFLNHWYWYPLMPMLSLNYLPTPFYVFDENLNEIKKSIKYKGNYDNHLIRLPDIKRSRGFKSKPTEDKEIITKAQPEVETSTRCTIIQQEECGIEWPGVFFTKQ